MAKAKKKKSGLVEVKVKIQATEHVYNLCVGFDVDKLEATVLSVKRGSIDFDWDKLVAGLGVGRIKNAIGKALYLNELKSNGSDFMLSV